MIKVLDKKRAHQHFGDGLECYFSGDRKGALKHGHLAVAHHLNWARPHWLLGLVYSVMEPIDNEEAIREYRELVRKEPFWSDGHYCLGRSLAKQGRLDAAISSLREAVRLDPKSLGHRVELARLLLKRNEYREAITLMRGRPSLSPFYTLADGYLMLAQTMEQNPNLSHWAEEVWREILTFDDSIPANRPAIGEARKRIPETLSR